MSEARDFLNRLRRGPVSHQEAAQRYGIFLPAIKRELASQGHILRKCYWASGTTYELSKDADKDRLFEGEMA